MGQLVIEVDPVVQIVFFNRFLFATGYKVGPQFVRGLGRNAVPQVLVTLVLALTTLGVTVVVSRLMGYDCGTAAGLIADFIGCVGLEAGPRFVVRLREVGPSLLVTGVVVALLPHLAAVLFGRHVLQMQPLILLGACAGAGTLTAALPAIQDRASKLLSCATMTAGLSSMNVAQEDLRRRLAFETVLSDLSSRFVNLEPSAVDDEIDNALHRVCECLGLDISSLWQLPHEEPDVLRMTHVYRKLDEPPIPEDFDPRVFNPWALGQVFSGKAVKLPDIEQAPTEAATDIETWRYLGIKSVFLFPLSTGGERVFGAISFHSIEAGWLWPDEIIQRLQLVSQIFANALVRKRVNSALRESEERLQLAADAADIGMWMLDIENQRFWATGRARRIFGYQPATDITLEVFLESVQPDDREPVTEEVRRALADGREVDIEYRIVLPDDGVRWVHSRGRYLPASNHRPARLLGATADVTESKALESELMDRLQFETLLTSITARFVNSPGDRVDSEIEQALCEVGTFFRADRCGLLEIDRGPPRAYLRFVWYGGGVPRVSQDANMAEYYPWAFERLVIQQQVVEFVKLSELPPDADGDRRSWIAEGVRSCLIVPLAVGETVRHVLVIQCLSRECSWHAGVETRLRLLGSVIENALERRRAEASLQRSFEEIERLRRQLELENAYLRQEHRLQLGQGRIVGESPAIMKVLGLVEQVAHSGSTVLIEGETGTGKELVAQRIHELSPRRDRPMVKVNCAALPSTLVESELFGHEKGAYTGAVSREPGRFEIADGSTIFLDEIAELPLELQAKLLRVLEEGRFERVGSSRTLSTDVRVVAATNRNLKAEVEAKRFRSDLFFRLAVFPITVPPLRERRGDIPLLVWAMVHELSTGMNRTVESIRREDMERLQRYDWPGNVRELRNVVERALILCSGSTLRIGPPSEPSTPAGTRLSLDEVQRRHILGVLEMTGCRIRGPGGAAELLGMKATTLRSRMDRLGLDPRGLRNQAKST